MDYGYGSTKCFISLYFSNLLMAYLLFYDVFAFSMACQSISTSNTAGYVKIIFKTVYCFNRLIFLTIVSAFIGQIGEKIL